MTKYIVKFQKGNKIHKVTVKAQGIIPAIEEAIRQHFRRTDSLNDSLSYEIISAEKI